MSLLAKYHNLFSQIPPAKACSYLKLLNILAFSHYEIAFEVIWVVEVWRSWQNLELVHLEVFENHYPVEDADLFSSSAFLSNYDCFRTFFCCLWIHSYQMFSVPLALVQAQRNNPPPCFTAWGCIHDILHPFLSRRNLIRTVCQPSRVCSLFLRVF